MKRSERLARTARHEAGMTLLFSMATLAGGAWAAAAALSGNMPAGASLLLAAAVALCLATVHGRESLRVARAAMREMEWEERP
jgi:hypothetical protein